MKKVFKKSLAFLIATLMVFSTMPLSAFAWDTGNLTFVKKETSWDGYDGKYSAYVHNGTANDFIGIVLKEVSSDGVIEVRKGSNFDITLSCGTWTSSSASNGTLPNNTLSWHYGNNDTNYVISSVDSSGSGLTYWKAFLGDDTTTEIQSAIEGEFATAATPSDSFRARASEGGTNEAYGVFKFTPTSFSQLNTPGEYTVRLAPTLVMNHWEGGWFSKQWEPKYGWGNYQWSINQGSPDTNRTIAIKVKVVADYEFRDINGNKVGNTITAAGATDALKNAPANTATTYTNSGNGFHNLVEYNWSSTPVLQGSIYVINESSSTTPGFCTGGTATCTSAKICDYCKTAYGSALGHSYTNYTVTKDATCSATGTKVANCDNNCGETDTQTIPINPDAHNYGAWTSISDTQHQRVCTYNNSHTEIGNHTFENGVCKVCSKPQTFTIKFKNQDGSEISSRVYNYGETVEIPDLPPTKYTYNDNETHTVTTYSWNFTPNTVAQGNATYQVTSSNSSPVACNFVLKDTTTVDGKTIDTFECSVCKGTIAKTVADMSALNPAIEELEALVYADGASYKYEATALANAKSVIAAAKTYAENSENRYAQQSDVNAQAATVNEAITTLKTTGLAQYTVTFDLVNGDTGETIETASSMMKYGDIAEKSYTFNKDEEGFPEYVVSKWTKKVLNDKGVEVETVLNSTANDMSAVVKENATYTCYVLKFKASDETKNETRVRYLDKSGKTLEIDYATVGTEYAIKESVAAPKLPYYVFDKWECVFGTPENVGTREIVYQAKYKYDDSLSNKCTIVGLNGVKVNDVDSCESTYDSKVILTGATKYAFSDSTGKIISYINADYIFTPHINNETVYITAVEDEVTKATTTITGHFVQTNAGTLDDGRTYHNLYVNAQFYLPEGASVVEAGLVLSKTVSTESELQIGKDKVTKLISTSESPNHEYSMAMSFVAEGTVNARSYLIYVDKSGTTQTVYSTVNTISYRA